MEKNYEILEKIVQYYYSGASGIITLKHYMAKHSQNWIVESDCSSVIIYSVLFGVGPGELLTIGNHQYGNNQHAADTVVQKVGSRFNVSFKADDLVSSDAGFILHWECDKTGFFLLL